MRKMNLVCLVLVLAVANPFAFAGDEPAKERNSYEAFGDFMSSLPESKKPYVATFSKSWSAKIWTRLSREHSADEGVMEFSPELLTDLSRGEKTTLSSGPVWQTDVIHSEDIVCHRTRSGYGDFVDRVLAAGTVRFWKTEYKCLIDVSFKDSGKASIYRHSDEFWKSWRNRNSSDI